MMSIEDYAAQYDQLAANILQECTPDRLAVLERREAAWPAQWAEALEAGQSVILTRLNLIPRIGSALLYNSLVYRGNEHSPSFAFARSRRTANAKVGVGMLEQGLMGSLFQSGWHPAAIDDYRRAVAELTCGQDTYYDLHAPRNP